MDLAGQLLRIHQFYYDPFLAACLAGIAGARHFHGHNRGQRSDLFREHLLEPHARRVPEGGGAHRCSGIGLSSTKLYACQ